ncbi:hypothetical protein HHK36_032691 [Tetracentron sinense]|uniref:RING-CH-type domain-containing protein n=1 Tax=Tetracentron sinense TaxID=13715 RepID=A0A835CWU1_TETSI|nr:hypothetical protein HHK36_032691 [Tetracentron sinense]
MERSGAIMNWDEFAKALMNRFGPSQYEDPTALLSKLWQTTSVKQYQTLFEELANRTKGLNEPFMISCFICGLKDEIGLSIQMLRPSTLPDAIGLARMQEEKVMTQRRQSRLDVNKLQSTASTGGNKFPLPPIKRLTPLEAKERRDKGLCYNCDEKFAPGHQCKVQKLFLMDGILSDENLDVRIEETADVDDEGGCEDPTPQPEISLHAIVGSQTPQTMRVKGRLGKTQIMVLVDSGSTHNFLNPNIARKEGLKVIKSGCFEVAVANGDQVPCLGRCMGVRLVIQGVPISAEFYLLDLGGCNAMLGAQWLQQLGPITWDFAHLTMKFNVEGRLHTFKGETSNGVKFVDSTGVGKSSNGKDEGHPDDVATDVGGINVPPAGSRSSTPSRRTRDSVKENFSNACKIFALNQQQKYDSSSTSVDSDSYSIRRCCELLSTVEGMSDDLYVKALKMFQDVGWRETFICVPSERRLLTWPSFMLVLLFFIFFCIGEELISPCMCKGTQQFVHRSCLDHWRSVKADILPLWTSSDEGFSFSHCTTCKAQFHLRVELLEDHSWRKIKFRILVARDVVLVFLVVQIAIAVMGGFAYFMDKNGDFRNSFSDDWDRILSKHPISFYYCIGVLAFFVLLGFFGLILHCSSLYTDDPGTAGCRNCCYGWGILDCFPIFQSFHFPIVFLLFALAVFMQGFTGILNLIELPGHFLPAFLYNNQYDLVKTDGKFLDLQELFVIASTAIML